eukprot:5078711-Pyramimonas_sp.AAC.1
MRGEAVQRRQLAVPRHERLSVELPAGPTPRSQDQGLARGASERAAEAAVDEGIGQAPELANHVWAMFPNASELEL